MNERGKRVCSVRSWCVVKWKSVPAVFQAPGLELYSGCTDLFVAYFGGVWGGGVIGIIEKGPCFLGFVSLPFEVGSCKLLLNLVVWKIPCEEEKYLVKRTWLQLETQRVLLVWKWEPERVDVCPLNYVIFYLFYFNRFIVRVCINEVWVPGLFICWKCKCFHNPELFLDQSFISRSLCPL